MKNGGVSFVAIFPIAIALSVFVAFPVVADEEWPELSEDAWKEMTVSEIGSLLEDRDIGAVDEYGAIFQTREGGCILLPDSETGRVQFQQVREKKEGEY